MSIIITNVGFNPVLNRNEDLDGWCDYEIRINNEKPIATFSHDRRNGLAVCLLMALSAIMTAENTDEAQ